MSKNFHWLFLVLGGLLFLLVPHVLWFDYKGIYLTLILIYSSLALRSSIIQNVSIRFLDLILIVFTGLHFLSGLWSLHGSLVLDKSMHWLLLLCIYAVARNLDINRFDKRICSILFLLLSMANCLIIIYVYVTTISIGVGGVQFNIPNHTALFITNLGVSTNYLGSLLVITIPFYAKLFEWRFVKPWISASILLLNIVILITLNSKGAILALLLSTAFLAWTQTHQVRKIIFKLAAFSAMAALITIVLFSANPGRFIGLMNPLRPLMLATYDERLLIWDQTLRMAKDHLITGVGAGNWPINFVKYGVTQFRYSFDSHAYYKHAHNLILETFAELGIPGGICILILIVTPFVLFFQNRHDEKIKSILTFTMAYIVVSMFYGIVYLPQKPNPAQFLWVLALGLLGSYTRKMWYRTKVPSLFWALILMLGGSLAWSSYTKIKINEFRSFQQIDQKVEAARALRKIISIHDPYWYPYNGTMPLKTHIGLLNWSQGNRDDGIILMLEAIEDNPFHYPNWIHLGNMYRATKNIELAKEAYNKAVGLNRNLYQPRIFLAQIALTERDWKSFDKNLSFYEEKILPMKEKYYDETLINSKSAMQNYWVKMINYEKQVLDLQRRRIEIDR